MNATTNDPPAAGDAWWRHPLLWMVIAGPALVVVASFVTFWVAWGSADRWCRKTITAAASKSTRPWRTRH